MKVHLKQFIQSLYDMKERLNESDLRILTTLEARYPHAIFAGDDSIFPDEQPLDEIDYEWLNELFAERWQIVADTVNDYTFDPTGINAPWIVFAKNLALELQKPYPLILIPTLANAVEPNNLSRLSEVQDLRAIFISKKADSNKTTWHRILPLYYELEKKSGVFGVLDTAKSLRPRALTLEELYRILSKRGDELVFTREGKEYLSFWDYIVREVLPGLQDNKNYPTYLLPSFLEVIEKYFEAKTNSEAMPAFNNSFKIFKDYLACFSLADINKFYGTSIQVQDTNYFLAEILLDCLENKIDESLDNKLMGVARWICQVDPSLVCKNEILEPVYESLHAGKYFNLDFLYELVADLNVNLSSIVRPKFDDLLKYIKKIKENMSADDAKTRAELVRKIKEMYAFRWEKIIDSTVDYMRLQTGVNAPWIRLAQYLAGAGFIEANYYRLLIPTLKQDIDPVSQEDLTTHPLYYFVLNTAGDGLVYLKHCKQHHQLYGTFFNCNYREPMPLSHKEKKRLAFADPEIYNYFLTINEEYEDPSLSIKIIDELRKLVNGSLNPTGLSNSQVSDTEYDSATKSYDEFLAFVSELSTEERNNLYRHRILFRSHLVSVQELFDLIQSNSYEQRECIAVLGRYFAKLVIDYAPETKFRDEIEQRVDIASMRRASARKVYSDYNGLTEEDAKRRLLNIFTSLMTHPFQFFWFSGIPVTFNGHDNRVTGTGKEIFDWINKSISKGDLKGARFLYVQLMEHIIRPALAKKNWWRYPDTDSWLTNLQNGLLFGADTAEHFNPELLLIVLWSWMQKAPKFKSLTENFLDDLVEILINGNNNYKKWVMVNIEFTKFLNKEVLVAVQPEILAELRSSCKALNVSPELIAQTGMEYLIHRLAQSGAAAATSRQPGMFNNIPGQYSATYERLKGMLHEKLFVEMPELSSEAPSLFDIVKKLQQIVGTNERKEFAKLRDYLQGLNQQPLTNPALSNENMQIRTVMALA